MKILTLVVTGFVVFCGVLVFESGLFKNSQVDRGPVILLANTVSGNSAAPAGEANLPASPEQQFEANQPAMALGADNAPEKSVTLGSTDPRSGFEFKLELSSRGASITNATFSNIANRDRKDPQPLVILSPVGDVVSMANKEFVFVQQKVQLPLNNLQWKSFDVEVADDGSQSAKFEAIIKNDTSGEPIIKLTKAYSVFPGRYDLLCNISVENLSTAEQKVRLNLNGPVGIGQEDPRSDDRKAIAGFKAPGGEITTARVDIVKFDAGKTFEEKPLAEAGGNFVWAAVTNKYFAAILVPMPDEGKNVCDWVTDRTARFYNPDGLKQSKDENIGVNFKIAPVVLAASGQAGSIKQYKFQLYLGPKDKSLFDKNELYRSLGFFHTIDFMPCFCCPAAMINPLAFGILALMKWMYGFIYNYGVVIIILVFLIRIVLHPITKKSQVSMSKFAKLAPKAEEIKKKYANNKVEMNKQVMALYKEQGASPVISFLPMLVQMPIWMALYGAIYASIDLRGAAFLPFWITDLSAPDAIMTFSAIKIPLFGDLNSLNLLPILMGVEFYLQQKLMPAQTSAVTNPQMAQQQKMMMVMMPILFPLMLYSAPSGLNLYIMASTFAGVIEQYVIKKHIKEKESQEAQGLVCVTSKTGGKVKKKKPKPFFKT
ncbi:MAG: YidC/Oxa1 family insertase periplasmic-domain containing protein [Planctomycetota bacterium]|nr:YidC/Oxa1 family insertase periplasmic-domain containing protein [Planctomycetota bacterium]